jgi:tetratricopeptide (TPR) repeat protein
MRLKALKINQILGSDAGMADNYDHLGQIYLRQGDLVNARKMFDGALVIARAKGHLGRAADLCVRLGHIYWVEKALDRARLLLAEALAEYAHEAKRDDQVACLVCLGLLARQSGDLNEAERRFASALDVVRDLDAPETTAFVCTQLGTVYLLQSNGPAAATVLARAQRLFQAQADIHGLGHVCGHLGLAAMLQDRFREAHAYLLAAVRINRRLGRVSHLADNFANLGSLYWSADKPHHALTLYHKAFILFERLGHRAKAEKTRALLAGLSALHGGRADIA